MSPDWALPALRWALYADLGVVFGVPMAVLATRSHDAIDRWRRTLAAVALAGIALGLLGFLLTLAAMTGLAPGQLDRALVVPLLTGTAIGWALIARSVALALCATATALRAPWGATIAAGGAAAATLAWSGHAAASQGPAGWIRLSADVVHLLGALGWVGGLILFAVLLWGSRPHGPAARALANFALAGGVIVGLLVATGAANVLFLVPAADLPRVLAAPYGRLLLAKLALTAAMVGLAALNRFALVPALERAPDDRTRHSAIARLRVSVTLELVAALAVLGLVARLGLLDPLGTGN